MNQLKNCLKYKSMLLVKLSYYDSGLVEPEVPVKVRKGTMTRYQIQGAINFHNSLRLLFDKKSKSVYITL